jgi:predicted negative regulator of RcsB-dependent stress response
MFLKGDQEEAIRYWSQSSAMSKPYSANANVWLASVYYRRGESEEVVEYLNKVPDTSFAAPGKYRLIANIMTNLKRDRDAAAAYERALEINSGQRDMRMRLIEAYEQYDPEKAEHARRELAYIRSFF